MRSRPITFRFSNRVSAVRIASGLSSLRGVEDIIGNLRPIRQRYDRRQVVGRFVSPEKDLHDIVRKRWFEKSFFKVVNEMRAAGLADEADFFLPGFAKVNVLPRTPDASRIEEALRRQPFTSGLLKIKRGSFN